MTSKNDVNTLTYPQVTYSDGVTASPNSSAENQLLIQAISTCAVPLVHQLIQQNPKIIHEKGWHGQTALHKACLIGDHTIVFLLLEAGADPNAPNEYNETPLHYACKRGNPVVINLLVQKGGNLDVADKNGMSMCHHAAQTGSVYALVFLYTLRAEYPKLNKSLQLPLHIACHFGHVDAFKYLLKKESTDISQADSDGNNVLHIAAREGHPVLCWDILKVGGCELLHAVNKDGFTPGDLASQRDKYGHKEIAPILEYYKKHKPKNYMVTDPFWLWLWLLSKPFLFYLFLLVLVTVVARYYPSYQGYIMGFGMILICWNMAKNLHRVKHVSRMPNPVFAGAFTAGLLHTTIHYLFFLLPYSINNTLLTFVSMVMLLSVYYMYYVLLTRNPGQVRQSSINPETNKPMTIADLCVPQKKMEEYCAVCEIVKTMRTHHCRLCEACYEEMDHHCLFIMKCIAINNHRLFVWFLIVCVITMILYIGNVAVYFVIIDAGSLWELTKIVFAQDAWTFSVLVANCFSIIWGLNLIRFQLQIVSKGQLTAIQKYTRRQSGLTASEKFWNMMNFLSGRSAYAKDPLLAAQNLL